jgi:hypothetical protein
MKIFRAVHGAVLKPVLAALLLSGLAGTAQGEDKKQEYLMHAPVSEAFLGDTYASQLWHICRWAIAMIKNGEYIEENDIKYTYYRGIRIDEKQESYKTSWTFSLEFASEGEAFTFFHDARRELTSFVPIKQFNRLLLVEFPDGIFMLGLIVNVITVEFIAWTL